MFYSEILFSLLIIFPLVVIMLEYKIFLFNELGNKFNKNITNLWLQCVIRYCFYRLLFTISYTSVYGEIKSQSVFDVNVIGVETYNGHIAIKWALKAFTSSFIHFIRDI